MHNNYIKSLLNICLEYQITSELINWDSDMNVVLAMQLWQPNKI